MNFTQIGKGLSQVKAVTASCYYYQFCSSAPPFPAPLSMVLGTAVAATVTVAIVMATVLPS